MKDLVARINIKNEFEKIGISEDEKKEIGLYTKLEGKQAEIYHEGDFRKLINYIVDEGVKSENENDKSIAMEVKDMLAEHNPNTQPFEVFIYDLETKEYVRNASDSESKVMKLEDKIKPYLKPTVVQPEEGVERELDYIDLVVQLNPIVGYKTA